MGNVQQLQDRIARDNTVRVNGMPLARFLACGDNGRPFMGEDGPDALELACWEREPIERDSDDGITRIGSRTATWLTYERAAFDRPLRLGRAPNSWKRHRRLQCRAREAA